jgi:hypothetical protein
MLASYVEGVTEPLQTTGMVWLCKVGFAQRKQLCCANRPALQLAVHLFVIAIVNVMPSMQILCTRSVHATCECLRSILWKPVIFVLTVGVGK